MLPYDRHQSVLEYLQHRHSATVKELAATLFASEATIRRDIAKLESEGYVERIYGGVLLAGHENAVVPVNVREAANTTGKEIVARKAAELVCDGDTVILDSSTTAFRICKYIRGKKHLKVITNNLRVCEALADAEDISVFCTGGSFAGHSFCFLGPSAEQYIRGINADILFFSSQAISKAGLITDVSEPEIAIRKAMLMQAKRKVFLCDSTKFGIVRPFTLCRKEDVSDIICDTELSFSE